MPTAAIYARFSSDQQRDTSIDDQIAAARALAAKLGVVVTREYADRAISGTRRDRPEFTRMLADARERRFDVLLLWDLKRLSRAEDLPLLLAQLRFVGVRVVTCDGYDSDQESAHLRGWVDALIGHTYLRELARNVHRGLAGQVERGLSAGGLPYGYRPVAREHGQDLEVDPEAADRVRWIYAQYLAGRSPLAIVDELNRVGVPGPRGGTWVKTALYGHPRYQTGILRNPIYVGRYVWNRSRWEKDPATGIRHRRERPPEEWMERYRPELRIVSDEVWEAVQARLRQPDREKGGRPPRTVLSGILRCGTCGGAVVAVSKHYYGCAAHKDRGPSVCPGVRVSRGEIEARIVEYAREQLLAPEQLEALRRDVAELLRETESETESRRATIRRRLGELEREIANLVRAAAEAAWSKALAERLKTAETEREALRAELASLPERSPVSLVPRIVERYKALVERMQEALSRAPDEAREALRQCFGTIRLVEDGGAVYAEISPLGVILTVVAGGRSGSSNHAAINRYPAVRLLL